MPILNVPKSNRANFAGSLPVITTRTVSILHVVEAVRISQYDLPAVHLGDHLDCGVAVAAHTQMGAVSGTVSSPNATASLSLWYASPLFLPSGSSSCSPFGVRHVPICADPLGHLLHLQVDLGRLRSSTWNMCVALFMPNEDNVLA